jgi:hypothetical protein
MLIYPALSLSPSLALVLARSARFAQDRTFVTQHKKTAVYELGLNLFRDDVVRAPRIRERLLAQVRPLSQPRVRRGHARRARLRLSTLRTRDRQAGGQAGTSDGEASQSRILNRSPGRAIRARAHM